MFYAEKVIGWVPTSSDVEDVKPELYREAARKLSELVHQYRLPDIQGELRELAARFERMAVYYAAQRTNVTVRLPI
jgi:hypothetical protein